MAATRCFARFCARARTTSSAPTSIAAHSSRSYSSSSPHIIPRPAASQPYRPLLQTYRQHSLARAARTFSSTATARHGHIDPPKPGEELWVTFIDKDGQEIKIAASKGDNLLDLAQAHDVEMEGRHHIPN